MIAILPILAFGSEEQICDAQSVPISLGRYFEQRLCF